MTRKPLHKDYDGPAGGWGSVKSLAEISGRERLSPKVSAVLWKQNKPDGFACVSCAWAKPADPHPFEFCENGAKATAWELTSKRATPAFFAEHTCAELRAWPDHDLEELGRLTHPMRYDSATDTYRVVDWDEAFLHIGAELRQLQAEDPKSVVFYSSGRASLETSYMYALFARLYGNNNLPDSSNMCHESTSVALPETIGVPVGTVTLDDFEKTDALLFFGQNPGSNSPRMLHDLQNCARRGVPIVVFNPLRERGLERFTNPQSPVEMLSRHETRIASQYHQVKINGDMAVLIGMAKHILALDDAAAAEGLLPVLDHAFIEDHTHGFEAFATMVRSTAWDTIEAVSGLKRSAIEAAAAVYASAPAVMAIYGMGLTQHVDGVETIQVLSNLLLLRGNIGRDGAGILPVRGHSNVQGQRTVGISEKTKLVPLDKLKELYDFDPPREDGLTTVDACKAILEGRVKAFLQLGGNFIRAVPDRGPMEEAWSRLRLTVQVLTKFNRSALVHGAVSYVLPCLGRSEIDRTGGFEQTVTMEDSTACIHASKGQMEPASPHLLSEPDIVARMAAATLPDNPRVPWQEWVADYGRIRDAIEKTYPEIFGDFNGRMWRPGGFHRPLKARHREWNTDTKKANFVVPKSFVDTKPKALDPDVLMLMTLRSNDQFNTTIYGYSDRFRGIEGTRNVVLMSAPDMARFDLQEGTRVTLTTVADDGVAREVSGLQIVRYSIPEGCIAAYYPECNPLIPVWHYAKGSKVPAAKSVPVRVRAS